MSNLHFVINYQPANTDRLFKIRPVLSAPLEAAAVDLKYTTILLFFKRRF